jgi:uncharacterized phage protein (TIGR02218 family)
MIHDLFRIVVGDDLEIKTWTSSDTDQVYNSETYTSINIGSSDRESKNQLTKEYLNIELPLFSAFAISLLSPTFDKKLTLTVYEKTEIGTDQVWQGTYKNIKTNGKKFELRFESLYTTMKKNGLGEKIQRTCPHVHYGRGCFVDKSLYGVAGTVAAINGRSITVTIADAQPDGWYNLGLVKIASGVERFIETHVGSQLTLSKAFDGLTIGASVTIYPGCDRSKETCFNKFDNILNYGGFPYIPIKNPYDGSSII